jgi:ABC-type Fe3+ transport system substrate-binding protein
LYEAAKQEGEVALWANTFSDATKVLKPFHDKYPGVKVKVWDASTGDDVINKLVEEGKVGRITGDIFFSGEGDLVKAVTAGLMQEHEWGNEAWPNQPPNKFYINYGTNPRLPVFNTNVIPVAEGPKSWEDLALPKWADKGPVASFSGSTSSTGRRRKSTLPMWWRIPSRRWCAASAAQWSCWSPGNTASSYR